MGLPILCIRGGVEDSQEKGSRRMFQAERLTFKGLEASKKLTKGPEKVAHAAETQCSADQDHMGGLGLICSPT